MMTESQDGGIRSIISRKIVSASRAGRRAECVLSWHIKLAILGAPRFQLPNLAPEINRQVNYGKEEP